MKVGSSSLSLSFIFEVKSVEDALVEQAQAGC